MYDNVIEIYPIEVRRGYFESACHSNYSSSADLYKLYDGNFVVTSAEAMRLRPLANSSTDLKPITLPISPNLY
jgi:hypothetical protein